MGEVERILHKSIAKEIDYEEIDNSNLVKETNRFVDEVTKKGKLFKSH